MSRVPVLLAVLGFAAHARAHGGPPNLCDCRIVDALCICSGESGWSYDNGCCAECWDDELEATEAQALALCLVEPDSDTGCRTIDPGPLALAALVPLLRRPRGTT